MRRVQAVLGQFESDATTAELSLPTVDDALRKTRIGLQLPRRDKVREIELAPLARVEVWKVPEIKVGEVVEVLGFTPVGDKGEPVLRAEFLFAGGKVYGLRSSPA